MAVPASQTAGNRVAAVPAGVASRALGCAAIDNSSSVETAASVTVVVSGTCHAGTIVPSSGVSPAHRMEAASTQWRNAAECFLSSPIEISATRTIIDTFIANLLSSPSPQARQCESTLRPTAWCSPHRATAATTCSADPSKKGIDQVPERRFARRAARHGRHVDVADTFLLVSHVPLVLQYPQLRANGGVTRVSGQLFHHVRSSSAFRSWRMSMIWRFPSRQGRRGCLGHMLFL